MLLNMDLPHSHRRYGQASRDGNKDSICCSYLAYSQYKLVSVIFPSLIRRCSVLFLSSLRALLWRIGCYENVQRPLAVSETLIPFMLLVHTPSRRKTVYVDDHTIRHERHFLKRIERHKWVYHAYIPLHSWKSLSGPDPYIFQKSPTGEVLHMPVDKVASVQGVCLS